MAASATGHAYCVGAGCTAASVTGVAMADGTAVSAAGPVVSETAAISGTSDAYCYWYADPCIAVSLTGRAHGPVAVSACDTLSQLGLPEACLDPV